MHLHIRSAVLVTAIVAIVSTPWTGCAPPGDPQKDAQAFLDRYTARWTELSREYSLAEWNSQTRIVPGDTVNAAATRAARERLSMFTGSKANIDTATMLLQKTDRLSPLQVRQLKRVLYLAADNPETAGDLVRKRIAAETAQTEKLYGFTYQINGKAVTPNQIDEILRSSRSPRERAAAWAASKEVGKGLRDGLVMLQKLRNETVQPLGYPSYFAYQVSDYGMSSAEMMALMDSLVAGLRPLYRELHTYARYELASRYGQPVPEYLPADWLPNRWGQDWSAMVDVEGMDLNAALQSRTATWIVRQGEEFYMSLGWATLPKSFWELSSLYPLPPDAPYKKNNHASAWHIDYETDVRSLMSVEPNAEWWETVHHELGHVYYFMSYTNKDVPPLLREGANRAYHEAIGSMVGLASMQKPYLVGRRLARADAQVDTMQALLKEALNYAVFIPWSAGVMSRFEHDLYDNNLPPNRYNARWWDLAKEYQGIVPPSVRGEEFCDAATKTHINDDAAQYYDYALSYALLFQLHDHIARKILKQDPRATDYYGSVAAGDFLRSIMKPGSSRDWRSVLKETTGEDLNAGAMVRYFEPLTGYLKKINAGRKHTI
ncbi:MAG: peptidase [Bacteroidetes bacterium]|nr:peptidase [Bacteroidota bacterium]